MQCNVQLSRHCALFRRRFFFSSLSSSCMVFEDGGDGKNELYCVQLDFAWYNGGQNFSEIIAILATYTA